MDRGSLRRRPWEKAIENSQHHVKGRSRDEDVRTLRCPGLGKIFAILVNAGLNALRLEGWLPPQTPAPLRAETSAFRPTRTVDRLYGRSS